MKILSIFKTLTILVCFPLFLMGCFTKIYTEINVPPAYPRPDVVTVFMDGTSNKYETDWEKRSNVQNLYDLRRPDFSSFYIDGVGNQAKLLGMGIALGTEKRVRKSYQYLTENYSEGDSLYIFGFSRGAYGARILSNLIYTAGILDLDSILKRKNKEKIIKKVYRKYRGKHKVDERIKKIEHYVSKWNTSHEEQQIKKRNNEIVMIEAMSLYESVEAFGAPDYKENFTSPNPRHLNQISNVKKVFHAMSLDDNRADIYTPALYSTVEINNTNKNGIKNIVKEVWFSGNHSNVGGSLADQPHLSNVSLHWMVSELKPYHLIRDTIIVDSTYAPTRSMQSGIFLATNNKNRSISLYYDEMQKADSTLKLKVHYSVFQRLEAGLAPQFKTEKKFTKDWFDLPPFDKCFDRNGVYRIYKGDDKCDCIETIYTKP